MIEVKRFFKSAPGFREASALAKKNNEIRECVYFKIRADGVGYCTLKFQPVECHGDMRTCSVRADAIWNRPSVRKRKW